VSLGPRKKQLDIVGNPGRITLGFWITVRWKISVSRHLFVIYYIFATSAALVKVCLYGVPF